MLVILMEDQIFPPEQICQSCLMADSSGQPRWRGGKLRCGEAIHKFDQNDHTEEQLEQYECAMGFRIANIK
jgi:hypothetical protein